LVPELRLVVRRLPLDLLREAELRDEDDPLLLERDEDDPLRERDADDPLRERDEDAVVRLREDVLRRPVGRCAAGISSVATDLVSCGMSFSR
jgi:hypothetical protein